MRFAHVCALIVGLLAAAVTTSLHASPMPGCPAGEIADCCGNCCPETWVGDGYCDNGAYIWNGVPIWLNCDEFDCDAGDCGDDCTTDCDDGGGGDCPAGEIEDCNDNCCPDYWVGDGYCDDGTYEWNGIPIYLNCDEFDCDGGDCTDCGGGGGDCPAGEIADCCGNCCPDYWVGDGYCDNGAYTWNGVAIWLNCDEFDCDAGDCGSDCTTDCDGGGGGDCPAGEIEDCNDNCCPDFWVGDGYCDDGTYEWNGIPIYLNCDEFNCDGGDCDDCDGGGGDCPAGEIEDCNDNCCPESWVGDGYCDDGTYEWNGIPIYLNCDEFNCDGGDCDGCDGGDPTGACCVGDDCTVGTQGDCADAGGSYLGDGSNCSSDPCGTAGTGACCVGDDCGVMDEGQCEALGGSYQGDGAPCEGDTCDGQGCTADINGSGEVNVADLLTVIDQWGCMGDCSADVTGDGEVGVDDVLAVLGQWGPCP